LVLQVRWDSKMTKPFGVLVLPHAAYEYDLAHVREQLVQQLSPNHPELETQKFAICVHSIPLVVEQESKMTLSELFEAQDDEYLVVSLTQPAAAHGSVPASPQESFVLPPEMPRRVSNEENVKVLPNFNLMHSVQTEDFLESALHLPLTEATVFAPVASRPLEHPHEELGRKSAYHVRTEQSIPASEASFAFFGQSQSQTERSSHHPIKKNSIFGVDLPFEIELPSLIPSPSHERESVVKLPSGAAAPQLANDATTYLECDFNEGQDGEFLDRLQQALDKGTGDLLKIIVMDPHGRFVKCENLVELNQILDFCKHEDVTLAKAKTMNQSELDKHVMWIDLEGCNVDQIVAIGERLDIHPLTVEDLAHKNVRQKLEPFDNYIFIAMQSLHHTFHSEPDQENAIKILVFPNLVLSMHFYPSFAVNTARTRLRKVNSLIVLYSF
jgi:hypothetical protein